LQLGFLPSFWVWIRGLEHGMSLVMILIFVVALNDVAAMLIGRMFGKTPLSPSISPKKTVEGSLAGLITATVVFMIGMYTCDLSINQSILDKTFEVFVFLGCEEVFDVGVITVVYFVLVGLLFGIIAQTGDLLESVFKRRAGVKNSGDLLNSHGGILDRVDSHYFTAWFAYLVFVFLL